ncbi:MAG: leucine-rich repeat domain-containing protein [Treponema sp.]|nr:leucine-rich repeat domain-containing protein [Treponema sp.]
MKKTFALHVIATMGFVAFGALALASANGPEHSPPPPPPPPPAEYDFLWAIPGDDGGITLTRYTGHERNVVIPWQLQGMPVTGIGSGAFWGGFHLTGVTIPGSVIHIRDRAFANNRLTSVAIPNSVVYIGSLAFEMNRLTSINVPDSVIHIGDGAFANNPTLTSITIGDGVGVLYEGVFSGGSLRNVSSISIGANVALRNSEPPRFIAPERVVWRTPESIVWRGFRAAYEANGHRAGVYTVNAQGVWSWQAR